MTDIVPITEEALAALVANIKQARAELVQLHSENEGLLAEITRLRAKLRRVLGR